MTVISTLTITITMTTMMIVMTTISIHITKILILTTTTMMMMMLISWITYASTRLDEAMMILSKQWYLDPKDKQDQQVIALGQGRRWTLLRQYWARPQRQAVHPGTRVSIYADKVLAKPLWTKNCTGPCFTGYNMYSFITLLLLFCFFEKTRGLSPKIRTCFILS